MIPLACPSVLQCSKVHAPRSKTGRMYGDVPTEAAQAAACGEFSWVGAYETGRSYQELEVCHVFPELQVLGLLLSHPPLFPSLAPARCPTHADSSTHPCPQVTASTSVEDRQRARKAAAEKLNNVIESGLPCQRYLVAQRGNNWMASVPQHMKGVFKDPTYRYANMCDVYSRGRSTYVV